MYMIYVYFVTWLPEWTHSLPYVAPMYMGVCRCVVKMCKIYSLSKFQVFIVGFFSGFFWPSWTTNRILVSQLGIESEPLAVKAQSPNQWTVREAPQPPRCVPQDSLPWTSSPTLCYVILWIQLIFSPSLGTSAYNPMVNYIWDANKKVLCIFN